MGGYGEGFKPARERPAERERDKKSERARGRERVGVRDAMERGKRLK